MIDCIWQANKICYLPVLTDDKKLIFSLYQQNGKLQLNRYGILEPSEHIILDHQELDMVIMPLLAVDQTGFRLGSGGGYYDRTFAEVEKKPLLMGLAYAAQITASLPHDPWDIRLDGVITEEKMFLFNAI